MRIPALILAASLLAGPLLAHAEPLLINLRDHIETAYQSDVAACQSLAAVNKKPCLKTAAGKKKQQYITAWNARASHDPERVYAQDMDISKPLINQDYKTDLAFCKELDKAGLATCQREALARKKRALKYVMGR